MSNKHVPLQKHEENSVSPAKIRLLHAAPHAAVDVFVNEKRIFRNFEYKDKGEYLTLPPGKCQLDLYPTGETASIILSSKIWLKSGKIYTVVAYGASESLKMITFEDNPYVPKDESKVRFIHLSYDSSPVDIAVKDGDVIFPILPFGEASEYLTLYPMKVDFEIRTAGTKDTSLSLPGTDFQAGTSLSIYIIGSSQGQPELETLSLTP